jgi:hypothetical protein
MARLTGWMPGGIILATTAWAWAGGVAAAQVMDRPATASPAIVTSRVPHGGIVLVTDAAGVTIRGRLAAATADAVEIDVGSAVRRVAAGNVARVQWRRPDSALNGALIGAAIGAAPGLYWLAVDPNECTGMCPEEYAFIAIGAIVGGLIDHAIKKKVTVYTAHPPTGRAKTTASVGPVVTRTRAGARLILTF